MSDRLLASHPEADGQMHNLFQNEPLGCKDINGI